MLKIPGKIPITIQPFFWIFALLIGWLSSMTVTGTMLWLLVIFSSIIIHEFGHALTALYFGQKARIELAAFGGFTYREGARLKLWKEFIVVLNGPIAGLLLFAIAWGVSHALKIENPSVRYFLQIAIYVNLIWTLINLAPVLPLDGGHLLSIALEAIFGFKGIKIALIVGMAFSIALAVFFFIISAFLIGAIFLILTFESARSFRFYRLLSSQDRDADLQERIKEAQKDLQMGNKELAFSKFEGIRNATKEGILHLMAIEQMAVILHQQHRYEEAYQLLKPLQSQISAETLPLFQFLAYINRDYPSVTKVGDQCYQLRPTYDTALLNALAYGIQAKAEPAIGWLECALRQGAPTLKEVLQKQEFDPIRHEPLFKNFIRTIS